MYNTKISKSDTRTESRWIDWLTSPIFVPITDNPESETDEQLKERHEKFLKLPKNIRHKLASPETSKKIQVIGQKYGFELLRLANITRLIRERYIKHEILDWDPWKEYIQSLPKLSIKEAVQKYPRVGEQRITEGEIQIKSSDEPVSPSIINWVHDYVLHLGQEKHSTMERTDYLFHAENTKELSSQDREKLAIILKSFDENFPLPIDTENNEVVLDYYLDRGADKPHSGQTQNLSLQKNKGAEVNLASTSRGDVGYFPQLRKAKQDAELKTRDFQVPEIQYTQKLPTPQFKKEHTKPYTKPNTPKAYPKPPTMRRDREIHPHQKNPIKELVKSLDRDEHIGYSNPYPQPGTHAMPPATLPADKREEQEADTRSPVRVKGFTEHQKTQTFPHEKSADAEEMPPHEFIRRKN